MKDIQPYILGIHGLELTEGERAIFKDAPPFGIILFLRNVSDPEQLRALISDIKTITDGQTMIFIDQEGGRVQRLAPPYWTQFPIAGDFSDLEDDAFETAIYALYRLIADELAQADIDVNCAPCLDLRDNMTAKFLQDRSFSSKTSRVILAGHASTQAMKDAGIAPVLKHIPGHGRGTVDSHLELPKVIFDQDPYKQLPDDAVIFQEDYGVDMAMNAHILYPQIDPEYPLTLSPKGIDFIRNVVGFDGLIMSDDLAMKALDGTQGELAQRAFNAGLDIALSCEGDIEHIEQIYSLNIPANVRVKAVHEKLQDMVANRPAALDQASKDELMAKIQVQVQS